MQEKDQAESLPIRRSDRVIKIARALSDCEREELRLALNEARMSELTGRLDTWNKCFRAAVHPSIGFGVFYGLVIVLVSIRSTFSVGGLLELAVLFAACTAMTSAVMTLVLALSYRLLYPRVHRNLQAGKSSTFFADNLEIPLSLQESLQICQASLQGLKGFRLEKVDQASGYLQACSKMTVSSPGERVEIKLEPASQQCTMARIYSKDLYNSWPFGKNRKNVQVIKTLLEEAVTVHNLLKG